MSELDNQLAEAVKAAVTAGKGVAQFVGEQAPDVVNQYLAWEFASNLSSGIIFTLIWVASAIGITKALKFLNADKNSDQEGLVGTFFFLCCLTFGCFLFSINQFYDAAKIKIAPKVLVIEYVQRLR